MSMKKKVLCFFSLVLYLLVACTILSHKIEEEMRTQVEIEVRTTAGSSVPTSLHTQMLFIDDQGQHLYEVIDGTGWESGLRIHEISADSWSIQYAIGAYVEVVGGKNYRFVESASRQPPDGRLAQIIETFETVDDRYLAVYSGGVPETLELPENAQITVRNDNALLLNMKNAALPFFAHKVRGTSATLDAADRIISLTEAERFLENLPSVTMAALVLAAGLILWAWSCCLSIRADDNKVFLWLNTAAVIASLYLLQSILNNIDLPASLLPSENILDWQHYREEFFLIFNTLEAFPKEAQSLIVTRTQMFNRTAEMLRNGIFLLVAVVFTESVTLWARDRYRKWKKRRYVGKFLKTRKARYARSRGN